MVATIKASPVAASQAEKVSISIGIMENENDKVEVGQMHRPTYIDNIVPSRHSRADRRWERFKASPVNPKIKAEQKLKWISVIELLWGLTIIC